MPLLLILFVFLEQTIVYISEKRSAYAQTFAPTKFIYGDDNDEVNDDGDDDSVGVVDVGASASAGTVVLRFSLLFFFLTFQMAYNDEEGRCIITHLFANKICNIPKM